MTDRSDLSEPEEPDGFSDESTPANAETVDEASADEISGVERSGDVANSADSRTETNESPPNETKATSGPDETESVIVAETIPANEPVSPDWGGVSVVTDTEPVLLELVADPPNPLRFGLRAMFVLTAMFAIQFAIISYLGPLLGLLTGVGVCAVVMTVIVVIAIVFHEQHRQPWMVTLDVMAIRVAVATVLLFVFVILAGGGYLVFDRYVRYQQAASLQTELGFAATVAWGSQDDDFRQVIRVTSVTPASIAEKAGMKADDVIMTKLKPDEFYDMLLENRGNAVTITLADDPELGFLEDASLRQIELSIPRGP